MKVLFDTNIIMDEILAREPFCQDSRRVIEFCSENEVEVFLAVHTITNLFYLLRKNLPASDRRTVILNLFKTYSVVSIDTEKLVRALSNEDFKDFEDCLQVECAAAVQADYIITRDKNDFAESEIPCVTPAEFFNLFDELEEKI